jgi:hypothetical protein
MAEHFFFRQQGRQRQKYRFVIDENQTILSESLVDDREEFLRATGAEFTRQPNGGITITKIDPVEAKLISLFSDAPTPCWFDGCQEIVDQYQADLKNMPTDCPTCQKSKLIRKYYVMARDKAGR